MKLFYLLYCLILLIVFSCKPKLTENINTPEKEKTAFQTSSCWLPEIDVRSDIAIVYGTHDSPDMTFQQRVDSWRARGYITHFMTGIAWGGYNDYYNGKWDGENHLEEVTQRERGGIKIIHSGDASDPYVVPVKSFVEYLQSAIVKKAIDAGINAIYLEEPEYWARAGYSETFKKEWKSYYGFPWKAPHESAENTYLSNKLKYQLYYNAIKEVAGFAKTYGKTQGRDIKVYIPTHSLVNYSSWSIVSPEASLASLDCIDGYIAQVWTGTARSATYYNAEMKERVFENAFLEYGSMVSMTAPTKRKIFFLTDPIEDRPRDWVDYKRNYEATFTAQLLYPMVSDYEVMPWPTRIYKGLYQTVEGGEKTKIPRHYSTQMQVMINTLNNMPASENKVSGSHGIGVLMSNSLMFQRLPVHKGSEDPRLSNFYGQAFPLLKRGVPVETVHMENLSYKATLEDLKVLIMSYSNMKPQSPESHQYIADWVKKGGALIYCGRDDDPYQSVMEWWNQKEYAFKTPAEHLFKLLGIDSSVTINQSFKVGKGNVYIIRQNPKEFVMNTNGENIFINYVKKAYKSAGRELIFKNNFHLQRGPYDIISVMDESVSEEQYLIKGAFIDLYDPNLPVIHKKVVMPGTQALLYNMDRIENKKQPQVLAAAARIYEEKVSKNAFSFIAKSPVETTNSMRVLLPDKPKKVVLKDSNNIEHSIESSWDIDSNTCYLSFENSPEGISIEMQW